MRPQRAIVLIVLALGAACVDVAGPSGRLFVNPLLDSLFVGDTTSPRAVVYVTASGDTQPAGPVQWTSSAPTVATVDSLGRVAGKARGIAILTAQARGAYGYALLAVSNPLDLSLLLDTLYLMPGDTFSVQYQLLSKDGSNPPVSFSSATNSVFSIDAAGLVTAVAQGGPFSFSATAGTATATGTVEVVVVSPTDTTGKAYLTVLGTAVRHRNADVRAVTYRRAQNTPAFRLNPTISGNGTLLESVVITLPDSVGAPGVFAIDELTQDEAFGVGSDPICKPPRPWGLWSSRALGVTALSNGGDSITISSVRDIPGQPAAKAISGWFYFLALRTDFDPDPLGLLPVRGSFVVPLLTDTRQTC